MDPGAVDVVVGAILGIAALRGLFLGLVRETFSIASLGAACVAVELFRKPAGSWIAGLAGGAIGPGLAPWVGGAAVAVLSIAIVVLAGRTLRRGVRWAGLGWADRAGGLALGAAEGALVAGVLLLLAATLLGRGHPALETSQSFAALEQVGRAVRGGEASVAAPPPRGR